MRLRTLGGSVYLFLVYLFLFWPIFLVIIFSFNDSRIWAFPLKGITFRWYTELFARPEAINAAFNSLVVAVPSVTCSLIIAASISVALHRGNVYVANTVEAVVLFPLMIPHIIWAIALLLFLVGIGLRLGSYSIVLGHVLLCTPFSLLIIGSRLRNLDPNLEDAARSLGARSVTIFARVVLPHIAPALIASAVITFAISYSELVVAFFLTGGGFTTLPIYIYSLIQNETSPVINAVATAVLMVGFIAVGSALMVGGREGLIIARRESADMEAK